MIKELEKEDENLFSEVEGLFYNYENIKKEIEYLDEEIEFLKLDYIGCEAINYSEKVQTSNNISSSIEKELIRKEERIKKLEHEKLKKEIAIKRVERAKSSFNLEEEVMFKIRYMNEEKDWTVYGDKMNVGRDKYYYIKNNMIHKSINIMFPYHNFKGTAMENIVEF